MECLPIPSFSYCIAFSRKIKEIFSAPGCFFAKIFEPKQRKRQQICQVGQGIRPKGPHRAQHLGERAEKQHRAAHRAQYREATQLSFSPPQEKEERGGPHSQAIGRVQHGGEAGRPQAKRAQQVIQHPGGQAQQDGLPEHQQLLGDLIPHTYPNRRLKKPPRAGPSSS